MSSQNEVNSPWFAKRYEQDVNWYRKFCESTRCITFPQRNTIQKIEKKTNIKFTGICFSEAEAFIEKWGGII